MKPVLPLTALALLVAGGAWYVWERPSTVQVAQTAHPVAVVTVERQDLDDQISLSASFRPYQEADIRSKVAGSLKSLTVDIGDEVKAGQILAKIDTDELAADYAHNLAAYKDAKLEYDRIMAVTKIRPGLLAQSDVDKSHADFEMAQANMAHAQTFMDYATIRAPFDGVVTQRFADPGAFIQAGGSGTPTQPIVHIADNTHLRLDFPVPEAAVPQVNAGTPVTLVVQATGQTLEQKVTRTSGKVDDATHTMNAEVDMPNPGLKITPGMFAAITVNLQSHPNVLALPVQALTLGDHPTVWLVTAQHTLEQRPVMLGLQTPDKVEITSGLQEGEQVVFGTNGSLHAGMAVVPHAYQPTASKTEK